MTTTARPLSTPRVREPLRRLARGIRFALPSGLSRLGSRVLLRALGAVLIIGIALLLLSFCRGTSRPAELAQLAVVVMTVDAFLSWLFMYRHRYRRDR